MQQASRHCLLLIMTILGHDHSECCRVDKEEVQLPHHHFRPSFTNTDRTRANDGSLDPA
jgi:hypothetical protein